MIRRIMILIISGATLFLGVVLVQSKQEAPLGLSLETLLRVLGKPLKTVDRLVTRIVHITPEEERRLALLFLPDLEKKRFIKILEKDLQTKKSPQERKDIQEMQDWARKTESYLQSLMDMLAKNHNPRGLTYRVFLVPGGPNAHALPGGLISVTTGMIDVLETESQIVAVLAHEKGHIDLGHGLDRLRFMATSADLDALTLGNLAKGLADVLFTLILNHTYSKTQEYEADFYAYETLLSLGYDPEGQGQSDFLLLRARPQDTPRQRLKKSPTNPFADYLKTHPSSEIRSENFINRAQRFKALHPQERGYVGKRNYQERIPRFKSEYSEEFSK